MILDSLGLTGLTVSEFNTMREGNVCFFKISGAIYFQAGNQCIVHSSGIILHALLVHHNVWITICLNMSKSRLYSVTV